jgi:hypothetical protein
MAAVPRYISPYNVAIPQATGQVIQYIRNADDFRVNKYVQLIESPGITGVYFVIDRDTPPRVVEDATFAWADGADRPTGQWNQLSFNTQGFQCQRRAIPWRLGQQAIEMAKDFWDVMASETASSAQQAMTLRTWRVIKMAENVSNWGTNTADAGTLNGLGATGTWDKASDDPADTGSYNAIKKSLLAALSFITLQTNSAIKVKDLRLIISPELAELMANSAEISHVRQFGPYSQANLEGSDQEFIERWGLPPRLYGIEIVIEDAVRVTDRPAAGKGTGTLATTNRVYIKSISSAILASRPGGLDGAPGSKSFSTFQVYWYENLMNVEAFWDAQNKRVDGSIVEQFCEVLAAPEAGMLITNAV